MAVFFPIVFPITSIVDRFVAGPTINTTNPAAGFIPFAIRDATNGTEPVEQMYIGVASRTMMIKDALPPRYAPTISGGIIAAIMPAPIRPTRMYKPMSSIISMNPYLNTVFILSLRGGDLKFWSVGLHAGVGGVCPFKITPASSPVITATQKEVAIPATVNLHPSIPKTKKMEVIDVAGVAIRKASVDGLDAPCSYKLRPVGMTPHEHRGNGIPTKVAVRTDLSLLPPRYLSNISDGMNAFKIPANKKPKSSQGDASSV